MSAPRLLHFFDLTVIGVGSSLGIGLFVLIGELIKNVAGPAVVVSIFVAGVTAILTGLCFAELGIRLLKIDSIYMYCYSCNREPVAFVVGWALLLNHIAGVASVVKGIIAFIDAFTINKISNLLIETAPINFEYGSSYFDYFALILVFVLMISLLIGLKDSLLIKKIFTAFNIILVLSVIVAGSFKADIKHWNLSVPSEGDSQKSFAPFGFLGVVKGAALSYYGFIGFDKICLSGNETRKTQKHLPLSIFASLFIILLAYEGTGVVLTLIHPYDEYNSNAALPFAFEETAFKWISAGVAFFAFQTSLFGAIFTLPKVIYFMANDGLLFYFLGSSQGRCKSPSLAIVVGCILAAVLGGFFNFQQLVSLTVISTLFVCTVLAVDVLILRYFSEKEENGRRIDEFVNWSIQEESFTIKETLRSSFRRKTDIPTKLTEKVIIADIIIFCASSIGLSATLICFNELLFNLEVQVLLPAVIILIILFLSLISMACQPKSQKDLPFKVPLIPFTPCLSIFLNIFLMISFESSAWILFSVWMGLGISLYVIWFCLKYCRGQTGKDSLYEINRMNAVKLNESIWKIRLEKKSFYEGAINPVFIDELEDKSDIVTNINENEIIICNDEKASVQTKHDVIIEADDLDVEENTNRLKSETEVENVDISGKNTPDKTEISQCQLQETDDNMQLECVAEVHMEEIFSQESVALEIVDNTYKFLKEISEDPSKDEIPEKTFGKFNSTFSESNVPSLEMYKNDSESENKSVPFPPPLPKNSLQQGGSHTHPEFADSFGKQLVKAIQSLKKTGNKISYYQTDKSFNVLEFSSFENNHVESSVTPFSNKWSNQEKNVSTTANNINETHNISANNILNEKTAKKDTKQKHDDHKKIKNFKERLNELLKNQMNSDSPFTGVSLISKPDIKKDEIPENNEKINHNLYRNIKTLKKSEMKDKLELLLSKGPPKRVSLKNSFNAGIRDTNKENDGNNIEDDVLNIHPGNHVVNEIGSKVDVEDVASPLS